MTDELNKNEEDKTEFLRLIIWKFAKGINRLKNR